MKPGFIVIGKANCLVRPKLKSTEHSNDEESKPFGILPQKHCPPSFSREGFSIWLSEKLFSSGVCPTCPQLTRIMLAKVFRSRKMNVASAWLLHPGSSKQVNKQARLNWYTGECPSCETALIGLANKAYSGKIFCACTSGFELPDSDMVISILFFCLACIL